MAEAPGFEPGNAGIKTLCLTAWLCPNKSKFLKSFSRSSWVDRNLQTVNPGVGYAYEACDASRFTIYAGTNRRLRYLGPESTPSRN